MPAPSSGCPIQIFPTAADRAAAGTQVAFELPPLLDTDLISAFCRQYHSGNALAHLACKLAILRAHRPAPRAPSFRFLIVLADIFLWSVCSHRKLIHLLV